MNCYICNQMPPAGGIIWIRSVAVGVCSNCGIGVCSDHSEKANEPGASLLCSTCASLDSTKSRPVSEFETQLVR